MMDVGSALMRKNEKVQKEHSELLRSVSRIRIRMFLGPLDLDTDKDPLVRGTGPTSDLATSFIKEK